MIKKILYIAIGIIFIVITIKCKKDSSGNIIIPGINTSMSAKINGVDWSSIVRVCNKSGNTITLTGTSLDGKIVVVNITPNLATDSLAINTNYNLSLTTMYKDSLNTSINDICVATTGTVKLTQLDKTQKLISGTFSFTALSTSLIPKTVTAGVIENVSYVGN
ncbi:MAG: DUF6252 family protein [Bacteroidota bacterium]